MVIGRNKSERAQPGGAQRRRSGRIMLTVPLRARGVDENGKEFTCPARTVSVNRHGAHIQLGKKLATGAKLRLTNLAHSAESEFRVVAYLGLGDGGVDEWGVETTDPQSDFWGIYFPYPSNSEESTSALAECQQCHMVALLRVSEDESGVLESGVHVAALCQKCQVETAWSSAEKILPQVSADVPTPSPVPSKINARRHARHYVQRPLTIRDASGAVEKTKTENVSRNGLCCTSERVYEAGQIVTLIWPHDSAGSVYEVQARVTRRHDLGGSARRIYGFDFELPPLLRPAKTAVPPAGFNWRFAALLAVAAVLAGAAVFSLTANFAFSSQNWQPGFELAIALLFLYFANRVRSGSGRADLEKHKWRRYADAAPVLALLLIVLGAAVAGFGRRTRRARDQKIMVELIISRSIERRLDEQERRSPVSAGDYLDDCETLRLLDQTWKRPLAQLNNSVLRLAATKDDNESLAKLLQGLRKMIQIDQEKLRVVSAQAGLVQSAPRVSQSQQLAFWHSKFDSLQSRYEELNHQRDAAVATITSAGRP